MDNQQTKEYPMIGSMEFECWAKSILADLDRKCKEQIAYLEEMERTFEQMRKGEI